MTKSYSNLRSLLFVCAVFLLSNFYSLSAFSQCNPVANDPSFNPNDVGFGNIRGTNGRTTSVIRQADGKLIIGGQFTKYNTNNVSKLVRIFPNGDIDTSFNTENIGFNASSSVSDMKMQNDGKIIAVGSGLFGSVNGNSVGAIIRLNSDGSRDASFNTGVGFLDINPPYNLGSVTSVDLQSDGKILLTGNFDVYNGVTLNSNNFIRLNIDGTLDTSFNPITNMIALLNAIKVMDNDKILMTSASFVNGQLSYKLQRLNPNGEVDTTFNDVEFDLFAETITVAPNGQILVGGSFTTTNGYISRSVVRLNSDGTVDTTFISGVLPTTSRATPSVNNIIINQDNDITIGGTFENYVQASYRFNQQYARLNPNGTLDSLHNSNFLSLGGYPKAMIELDQNRVLVVGDFNDYTSRAFLGSADFDNVMVVTREGNQDPSFNIPTGFDTEVQNAILVNNKIYVAGESKYYNRTSIGGIARLNLNGDLDTTYTAIAGETRNIVLNPNRDKFLINTNGIYNGQSSSYIMQINLDGSIDNSFSTNLNNIRQFVFQDDSKILIAGAYTIGSSPNYLYRLNENGSRDYSFNSGSGFNDAVTIIKQQNDGKILVGGWFSSYAGTPVSTLVRLLPNGSLDPSFNIGTGFSRFIYDIEIQDDGKMIIVGDFATFNSQTKGRIVRLNPNGSIDNTFNIGTGFSNGILFDVFLQSNGKILFNAASNNFNGNAVSSNKLMRLNNDGSIDYSFITDANVNDIIEQEDGKLILVGDFSSINGVGRNGIVRIVADSIFIPTNNTDFDDQFAVCPNTTTTLEVFNAGTAYWYDSLTSTTPIHTGSSFTTPTLTADSTFYYVKDSVAGCGSSARLEILVVTSQGLRAAAQNYTAYLDSMGTVTINALQIDSLSRAACNDTIVSYTFRDTGLETRSYLCADINVMHEVWLQVTDNNGNIDTAQAFIQVRDTIAPVAQTQRFAISLPTSNSTVIISARDFLYSLSDNCTDSTDIEVVFEDTGLPTKDIGCSSFATINSDIKITDLAGNFIVLNTIITSDDVDFDVYLDAGPARPALPAYIQLYSVNNKCNPASGQITVTLDNLLDPTTFYSNQPYTLIGNVVTWNFDNLADSRPFAPYFYTLVNSSANIGDSICYSVKIAPTNEDIASTVIKNYCFPVVNSYDPNDKQVYPQGICDAKFTKRSDLPLTYTIRFQNTGNAPALNVRIADSLSTLLNRRSLRIVGTSHAMVVDTVAGNNVINFRFPNINLPDSASSPELSQGYVIFELSEIAAHTDTSRISNKSYIYFDTNPAIITNTVKNTIVNTLPNCNPTNPNPPIAACTLPTNLRAEILTSTKVKLAWTNPAGTNAINYEILRNGQRLITVPASNLSFIDSTLIANTQYNYSIKAICGNSVATSNVVQVRTIPATPILLSVVAACKGEKGTINVQSAGAVYRVYSSATSTTPLFETNNASIETPILNDSTTFYISVIINGLESQRLKAIVPIKEVFDAVVEQGILFETCATEFNLSAKNVVGATYTWFRENLEVGTGRTLTTTFAARYKVRIIKNGCFADSEFTTTRFVSAPTAKIKQGTAITFCGSGTLNAQDTSANVVYTWSLNGTNVGNGTSVSISQSGTYTLKASQPSCESSVTIAVTITNAPANVALTASKTAICTDTQTTLSATMGTGFTYKWFRNNVAISNTSATLSTSEIGKYKVEVTTQDGCKVTTSEVEISRLQVNQATLRINTESGRDKTIDVTSQDAIDSVQWFKDGVLIPAFANKKLITPTETGKYKAKVTYSTGCKSETEEKTFTIGGVTGIEEESAKIFNIYPNPNNGSFKVEFFDTNNQKTNIVLVDGLGRIIYSQEISMNEKTISITLPKMSAGVYVVQIISNNKVYTKQLVIQ